MIARFRPLEIGLHQIVLNKCVVFWVLLDTTQVYSTLCCHMQTMENLFRKETLFIWTVVEEDVLQTLKHAMITVLVLALPDFRKMFVLKTEGRDAVVGGVLI